ncbi:TetR/AcrR family transcriptional regulator [Actinomadura nitritigenes]|uniref:TetR/AcrR family transcriptional regulator n=1 Tax=Actinomadura nitritigenes TaxID=134602 RepID=UPI003D92BCA5
MPLTKEERQALRLARREQLLDAGLETFAAEGYRGTTGTKIADRAEVNAISVTRYFHDKAELLGEVLRHRDNIVPDALARMAGDDIIESVRHLADLASTLLDHPSLMRFETVVGGESIVEGGEPFEHFQAHLQAVRQVLSDRLREAKEAGAVRADTDPDFTAAEVVAFMHGAQTQWLFSPGTVDLQGLYRHYFNQLAERLAPAQAPQS